MNDKSKIITGLIIFLGLVTLPIWYAPVSGKADFKPEPKITAEAKQCVEPTEYMRTEHMHLLIDWRESVVRNGLSTYTAGDGKKYDMSLTNTCMKCHTNKAEFCDQCHNYAGARVNCWDCHIAPGENK